MTTEKSTNQTTQTQIIKLTDVNIDGCGTDITVYIQIKGPSKLTDKTIEETNAKIQKYKEENHGEWDTDSIINMICQYLTTKNYTCQIITPDYEIEF